MHRLNNLASTWKECWSGSLSWEKCPPFFVGKSGEKSRWSNSLHIPRCSTWPESIRGRFSETAARDSRKMCRENGAEGRALSLPVINFFFAPPSFLSGSNKSPQRKARARETGFSLEISIHYIHIAVYTFSRIYTVKTRIYCHISKYYCRKL